MEVRESLRTRAVVNAGRLITKLSTYKIVFVLSSSGYCAIHWLVIHNFSAFVFSSALVFGAMAAMGVAWLANFAHRGRARPPGRQKAEISGASAAVDVQTNARLGA
jgi:hypothetical protein